MPYIGNTTSDFSIDTGNITNRAVTALKLSPSSVGSNGQVLSVDGSGNLQWGNDANAPEGTAVLSTGESGTTKYLRVDGDGTCSWQLAVDATKTTLTGSTNNTICTVTGANAITGEANLTFNDSVLSIINTSNSGDAFLNIKGGESGASVIELQADEADDSNDLWRIQNAGDSKLGFRSKESGSWVEKLGITADGNTTFAGSLIISEDNAIHLKGATDSDLDSIVRESSGNALLINSRNDAILNIDSNGDSTDAHFAVAHGAATSGSTELFRIDESCRVGIGGNGTGNGLGVFLRRSAPTTTNFYEASDGTKAMIAGVDSTLDYVKIGSLTAHRLGLVASNGEKISVLADGKVGIGTTSPSRNLHLVGSNAMILIEGSGGNGRQYSLASSDDTTGAAVDGGNPGTFAIYDDTANVSRLVINSSGNVGIGLTSPGAKLHIAGPAEIRLNNATDGGNYARIRCFEESSDNGAHLAFNTGAGEIVRFQNGGNVGIGTTAPPDKLNVVGAVRINQSAALDHLCNAGTMLEVRGDAIGSGVTDYDFFKGFKIALNDGSEWGGQAQFSVGRWQENGTNARSSLMISLGHGAQSSVSDADSDIMLLTSDGQVRIEDGNLKIGTAGHGIDFSADGNAGGATSEVLDDYEEGTFSVSFWASNTNFNTHPTLTTNLGKYVKVGNKVSISGRVIWSNNAGGAAGNIYMSGLPFNDSGNSVYSGVHFGWWSLDSAALQSDETLGGYVNNGQSYIVFVASHINSSAVSSTLNVDELMNGKSGDLQFNCTYFTS